MARECFGVPPVRTHATRAACIRARECFGVPPVRTHAARAACVRTRDCFGVRPVRTHAVRPACIRARECFGVPPAIIESNPRHFKNRGVAQLVARLVWDQDAAGSNPVTSTIEKARHRKRFFRCRAFILQPGLLPRIRRAHVRAPENVIRGHRIKVCQFQQMNHRDRLEPALVARIHRLADPQNFRHIFLPKIVIFTQIPQPSEKHTAHRLSTF